MADRDFYLGEEVHVSVRLVKRGLAELQSIDEAEDFYYPAMLLLSSGLERFIKCILCQRAKAVSGSMPSWQSMRDYGHGLEELLDQVVTQCFDASYLASRPVADTDATFLATDLRLRGLLAALSRFAKSARYYNLDMVCGRQPSTDDPVQEWQQLEMELVSERPDLLQALQSPGGLGAAYGAIQVEFVARMEFFMRAMCRLFTLGPLGDDARRYTAYLTPFLFLKDDELGKHRY